MDEREEAMRDLIQAKNDLIFAMRQFDMAEPEHFETANDLLTEAENRYKVANIRLHIVKENIV